MLVDALPLGLEELELNGNSPGDSAIALAERMPQQLKRLQLWGSRRTLTLPRVFSV